MKDICEATGLSRGGLYRHYESTEQIFQEIMEALLKRQQNEFEESINRNIPAVQILEAILKRYETEMIDADNSLSMAIYEFYSNPQRKKGENTIVQQYENSKKIWIQLIEYGISTQEFRPVEPEAVFDLIVFSYQGVRLYSKLMEMNDAIPKRIVQQIKYLLLPNIP